MKHEGDGIVIHGGDDGIITKTGSVTHTETIIKWW